MSEHAEDKKEKFNYSTLRKSAGDRYYHVSSNTQAGWFDIGSLDKSPTTDDVNKNNETKNYLFEVELTSDPARESSDVLNLQYFFIRTEQALRIKKKAGENAVFILLVKVQNQTDLFRVSAYLYLQGLLRQDMLFYIRFRNSIYSLLDIQGIGRLPPLICVAKKNDNTYLSYYQLVQEEMLTSEDIDFCVKEIDTYLHKSADGEDAEEEEGDGKSESSHRLTRLKRLQATGRFSSFKLICANYLIEALLKIRGSSERKFTPEEKLDQVKKVCKYITERLDPLTPLGQMIWFIYLYYMQEEKGLVEYNQPVGMDKGRIVLRRDRLDSSYMNAMEYADGVLQLLENSCEHTANGIGYLSIRVHYVDRSCPESDLERVAFNRSRLIQRYSKKEKLVDASYTLFPRRLALEDDTPYYFELRVTDDATEYNSGSVSPCGIPAMHAKNRKISGEVELYQVFGRHLSSEKKREHELSRVNLENVTCHYGVRQLQKIVLRSQGCFVVSTPSMKSGCTEIYSAYFEKQLPDLSKDAAPVQTWDRRDLSSNLMQRRGIGWQELRIKFSQPCRSTEYQLLLPISSRKQAPKRSKSCGINPAATPLDLRALKDGRLYSVSRIHDLNSELRETFNRFPFFTIRDGDSIPSADAHIKKFDLTKALEDALRQALNQGKNDDAATVYLLNFSELRSSELELAAKALFLYIGQKVLSPESVAGQGLLFAAYFKNLVQMQEFILDYSVFYDENGKNPYMAGTQIAVCSREDSRTPEVNFLLAGEDLATAWKTADAFAYYTNFDHTLALLPQLRYLSDDWFWELDPKGSAPIAPFPFDLYLNESFSPKTEVEDSESNKDVLPAPANDCWFMRQIAEMIGGDLRKRGLGCKIENVHVRLGSKMHLEDFYEAELLFQNISMVTRFAYLIVRGLLDENPNHEEPLLLLGYETYSTILLEYIVKFLDECGITAYYAIYGHDPMEQQAKFIVPAALRVAQPKLKEAVALVTIYPIGTTLSTVYHMIDSVPATYRARPWKNFCVLVVENENGNVPPRINYWTMREQQPGQMANTAEDRSMLTLVADKAKRAETKVRFYLKAKTLWHGKRTLGEIGIGSFMSWPCGSMFSPRKEKNTI